MLNPVSDALLADLRARLPEAAFRPLEPRYLEEPRGNLRGRAGTLVAPASVDEVAEVIRAAARHRTGVVPYSGGTGLVGGQLALEGPEPILLSLERMARIRALRPEENVIVAEAGVILADLHAAAEAAGRLFPLTYGSRGSARVGGALAVNSGGLNVLRYGTARALCLGLEAVLPDGSVWHGLKRLRKDNTGYDLRDLLIGAEGTLGVITAAALRLFPRPTRTGTALLVVPGPEAALALLARAGTHFGEAVSGFELISGQALRFIAETGLDIRQPFPEPPDWMVLIEAGMSGAADPDAALEALFAEAHEAGEVADGLVASSEGQRRALWDMREAITEANRRIGAVASHDIALPLGAIPELFARAGPAIAAIGPFRINAFGHLGDGNLHYNVFPPPGEAKAAWRQHGPAVTRALHDIVHDLGGSFSAEHGVGRLKVAELERYGDPVKLAAMRAIKRALDPAGIMNPGAVLRAEG